MKKTLIALLFLTAVSPVFVFAQPAGVQLGTPAAGVQPGTPGAGIQAGTPSAGVQGGTPPAGIQAGTIKASNNQPIASLPNPLGDKVSSIPDLFYLLVNALISVSYVVIAFFLIWSGFKFVVAQGEPEKLTDAKNTFKYTIIGALIIIGAQTIIAIVKSIISGLGIA